MTGAPHSTNLLRFVASRLGKALIVVLGVVVMNFILIRMAPGDPAAVLAGEAGAGDSSYVEQLRIEFGLDKPLVSQLGSYLLGVARLKEYGRARQAGKYGNRVDREGISRHLRSRAFIEALVTACEAQTDCNGHARSS